MAIPWEHQSYHIQSTEGGPLMNTEKKPIPGDLPQKLGEVLGGTSPLEVEGPGVYYLAGGIYGEFYIVEQSSSIISETAKSYGKQHPDFAGLLIFAFGDVHSGSKIIAYELEKYAAGQRLPDHDSASLRSVAVYAAEYHPEFFGTYPVPLRTPWGSTLRHKQIENGVYWLETDQCQEVLAICYPIWDSELSTEAISLGAITEYDQTHNIDVICYLFYKKEDACVPIFELLKTRQNWSRTGRIAIPALMNAMWRNHPGYVLGHNIREQAGANDVVSLLLRQFGMEAAPNISLENVIALFPDAGIEYLRF